MTRRAQDDDRTMFELLYRETRTDLLAYLARRAGTPQEAADTLAETYLIAWEKLHTIPPGDRARLWLFGVARNLHLQGVRRRRVSDALIERLAGELRTARAQHRLDNETEEDAAQLALSELSDRDQEILTLTAWDGLTPREIAAVIGTSANTVRVRLHRARVTLKRQLGTATQHNHAEAGSQHAEA